MRAFIAVDVPDEVATYVSLVQNQLRGFGQCSFPKSFHITLQFLEDIAEEKALQLQQELATISFSRFQARLVAPGVFPTSHKPRVAWIGIEPLEDFSRLQQQIQSVTGLPTDHFHPHITIARIKRLKDKQGFLQTLQKIRPGQEFSVSSFVFYKSTMTTASPLYEVLGIFRATET